MASVTPPPALEAHTFTGVAASGGNEEWISIDGVSVDSSVNGFVFDETDQKVLSTCDRLVSDTEIPRLGRLPLLVATTFMGKGGLRERSLSTRHRPTPQGGRSSGSYH